jgi:hypothetical protein
MNRKRPIVPRSLPVAGVNIDKKARKKDTLPASWKHSRKEVSCNFDKRLLLFRNEEYIMSTHKRSSVARRIWKTANAKASTTRQVHVP